MLEWVLKGWDRLGWGGHILVALLLGAACWGVPRLHIEESPERWMPESTVQAWRVFDEHFDVGDTIAVGLDFQRPVQNEDLPALVQLRKQLAAVAGMKQVYDVSLVASEIEAVPLTTLLAPENAEQFALYEGTLWSQPHDEHAGQTLLTVCELTFYPEEQADQRNAIRRTAVVEVYEIIERAKQQPEFAKVRFHVASGIVMMVELERRAMQVASNFLPMSIVLGLACLLLGFRSWRAMAAAMLSSLLSMCLVLGAAAWFGDTRLGVMTMAAPTLMSIVAIASTVHFAAYTADHGGFDDSNPAQREHRLKWVAVPCFGAALTTGVGFFMLTFNELGPVRDLGWQLFLGSLLSFFGVYWISKWLPIRTAYAGRWLTADRLRSLARGVTAKPLLLTLGMSACMVFLAAGLWPWPTLHTRGLRVDADPFSFFGPEQPITQARDHFAQCHFGLYQLEVVLIPHQPGTPGVGLLPGDAVFQQNQEAARKYSQAVGSRQDLGVMRVVSTQAFEVRRQQFLQDLKTLREKEGWLAAAAKVWRVMKHQQMFEETFQSWSRDKQQQGALRLTFLTHDQGTLGFEPLLQLAEQEMPRQKFDGYVSGAIATVVHLSRGLVTGMVAGLGTSLLIMALLCALLFRSPRLAAIAFLPNAFPVLAVYGMMGWMDLPISSGSAMVATVALGIALNDTIHFLLHYRKLTRELGHSTQAALEATFEHLGRPIVLTSLVHLAGFSIFLLTDFLPLYHFGLLAGLSMLAALAGDLLLLPNLLLVFDSRPGPSAATASPIPSEIPKPVVTT